MSVASVQLFSLVYYLMILLMQITKPFVLCAIALYTFLDFIRCKS